ncbi:hypothetical protein PsYK624_090610 [Phanerochaete sordida]|uniref:Uncharacterized protein n=1 Tax=Phanerochaete sordida TaxID=48140 RepID=A0A9P3GDI3_9APHY|nr:hypothetical protein PsYK624_090610 [Phanerochaete sordida]
MLRLARLMNTLFSSLFSWYGFGSASALYLPGNNISRTRALELTAAPQSASLAATFFLSPPWITASLASLTLSLPPETTTIGVNWDAWRREIIQHGLDSVPITVHTGTSATYDTPASGIIKSKSSPRDQISYTVFIQVQQLSVHRIESELQRSPLNHHSWHSITDYSDGAILRLPGVIIPQKEYKSPSAQAAFNRLPGAHTAFGCLRSTIIRRFDGGLGISFGSALSGSTQDLHAAHSMPHLSDTHMRVTLRILWPGYPDWQYENGADALDYTNSWTLEILVQKVARLVQNFYEEMKVNVSRSEHAQPWRLDRINFSDLHLVELRQVIQKFRI